uniref:Uncharacterized protein n=1 Tax=Acrobeloides nanus TaxID=290746 RepID=A0A914EJY6_9BILA
MKIRSFNKRNSTLAQCEQVVHRSRSEPTPPSFRTNPRSSHHGSTDRPATASGPNPTTAPAAAPSPGAAPAAAPAPATAPVPAPAASPSPSSRTSRKRPLQSILPTTTSPNRRQRRRNNRPPQGINDQLAHRTCIRPRKKRILLVSGGSLVTILRQLQGTVPVRTASRRTLTKSSATNFCLRDKSLSQTILRQLQGTTPARTAPRRTLTKSSAIKLTVSDDLTAAPGPAARGHSSAARQAKLTTTELPSNTVGKKRRTSLRELVRRALKKRGRPRNVVNHQAEARGIQELPQPPPPTHPPTSEPILFCLQRPIEPEPSNLGAHSKPTLVASTPNYATSLKILATIQVSSRYSPIEAHSELTTSNSFGDQHSELTTSNSFGAHNVRFQSLVTTSLLGAHSHSPPGSAHSPPEPIRNIFRRAQLRSKSYRAQQGAKTYLIRLQDQPLSPPAPRR